MKIELTKNEMLALWKRRHFLEPLRTDCIVERSDGVDLDEIAAEEMRLWYLGCLAEAPPSLLAPEDIALTAKARRSQQGTVLITLPETVVRVVAVKLGGWEREARIIGSGTPEERRCGNPFARGGVASPLAVVRPGNILELYSPDSSQALPVVDILTVITDPGPETYVMDERLISTCRIPL